MDRLLRATINSWRGLRYATGSEAQTKLRSEAWDLAILDRRVPGVGGIVSIVRWGSRWIVATTRGLISTLD